MNGDNSKLIRGHISALFVVLCWGTSFIVSKSLMGYMTAVQLIWMRFGLACLSLWVLYPKWHFSWKEEGWFFLLSIFSNTLYFLAENTALNYTQTSNVSILTSTIPLMTALLLWVFKNKRMSRRQITGLLIAFVGVVLVILNGVFILKLGGLGDLLALGAAFSWSCYSLLIHDRAGQYNSFLISRKLMFYGFLTMTPVMLASGAEFDLALMLGEGRIFGLLYLAVICSALCYALWNNAIGSIGISSTNTYLYAMPLFTLIGGALVLDERITLMGAAGMGIVIAGMLITNVKKSNCSAGFGVSENRELAHGFPETNVPGDQQTQMHGQEARRADCECIWAAEQFQPNKRERRKHHGLYRITRHSKHL